MTTFDLAKVSLSPTEHAGTGKPPARIYVSGYTYKLVAPYIARPPLLGTVKVILKFLSTTGTIAKNIFYLLTTGTSNISDPAVLSALAEAVKTAYTSANLKQWMAGTWKLQTVECHDNGSSSGALGVSTSAAVTGGGTGSPVPPQCAVVLSWIIAASYRGGKSRTYLAGLVQGVNPDPSNALLDTTACNAIRTEAGNFMANLNAISTPTGPWQAGTISYQTGHAPRPTPVFRAWVGVRVHERLDSQRRRSGKESNFPSVP